MSTNYSTILCDLKNILIWCTIHTAACKQNFMYVEHDFYKRKYWQLNRERDFALSIFTLINFFKLFM